MADTGWKLPTVLGDDGGFGVSWVSQNNLKLVDNVDASVSVPNLQFDNGVRASSFLFSLPAGATIDGIEVELVEYTGALNLA